jgi:ATP-binding cassette subfamily F protein uup
LQGDSSGPRKRHLRRQDAAPLPRSTLARFSSGDRTTPLAPLPPFHLKLTAFVYGSLGQCFGGYHWVVHLGWAGYCDCWSAPIMLEHPTRHGSTMSLVTLRQLSIRYRGPALLDEVSCQIEPGQRIGLLGRNGAGKSTLLKILAGEVQPDGGEVSYAPQTRVALLSQEVPHGLAGLVRDVIAAGAVGELEGIEPEGQAEVGWQLERRVAELLTRMELDGDAPFEHLSSGLKRRVLLAQALAAGPQLLMLDEPTNHLDIDAIRWLEEFLPRHPATLIFVTHDRMFLRKLANRIWEIDRGRLFDWSCDYDTFTKRKEAELAAEEKQQALFDKKLAQEEVWIRQGIKARRTRNEGRVRALEAMRVERQQRQERVGNVKLNIEEGQRSGTLIVAADSVSFAHAERPIVKGLTTTIMRGDRVGIIGPNGAGKTTLLRLLLGQLQPQQGSIRLGTNLQIAYFDQLRNQLHEDQTVQENVGDGYDTIRTGGQTRHVIGYLQDFLFSPERARTLVGRLSGGERNRVLLAKLFAKPANVIVLDEPTNDLDAETLELLEERLVDFRGTVLLVSHDREFLNRVVSSTLVFESTGIREYVGGYDDWLRQRAIREAKETNRGVGKSAGAKGGLGQTTGNRPTNDKKVSERAAADRSPATSSAVAESVSTSKKLSFREKRELDELPTRIEQLESQIAAKHQAMSDPRFYQQAGPQIAAAQAELKTLETDLQQAYERWETLEARVN